MRIMGVDPGQSGGVAVLTHHGVEAYGFTTMTEFDILNCVRALAKGADVCYLELVHSMPAQGVASSFKFGKNYGFLRACLMGAAIPVIDVSPQKWQKALGCLTKGDKNVTKAKAQQLYPEAKITHAIADAILIARYGSIVEAQNVRFT